MAMSPTAPTVAAAYGIRLLTLLQRWQITPQDLFRGIDSGAGSAPQEMVSVDTVVKVLERARSLTAEPGLGVMMALDARVSSHGLLGFAAMSAATFGDALRLAIRYQPIRGTSFAFSSQQQGAQFSLYIDERAEFGSVRDIIVLALVYGIQQVFNVMTGRELGLKVDLCLPRPAYIDRFAHALPPTRFAQARNCIYGPVSVLEAPLVAANAEAMELARAQCESTLAALGLTGKISDRVRAILNRDGDVTTLEAIAAELGMSARTLRRKLDTEGTPFANLLAEVRQERAQHYLRYHELSVEQIADQLGYRNVGAFSRAFARWTGQTPTAYRKSRESSRN